MSNIIDSLIFDRTAADVAALSAKGNYNSADLNRVESAVVYLSGVLNGYGYAITTPVKTNWVITDTPKASDMERYRQNVARIRAALAVFATTPATPATMNGLTYEKANDIEQILADVDQLIANMEAAWFYAGDLFSGEV